MKRSGLCGGIILALSLPGALQAGEYAWSVGAEVTRGDYGTSETSTVWTFPVGLGYESERLAWAITVPYVIANAPEGFVVSGSAMHGAGRGSGGGGGGGGSTTVSGTRTEAGIGDATASLSLPLLEENERRPWLGVTGEVKFATGDEQRGLGTGAEDYALQLEAAKGWLNGRLGYRWLGDSDVIEFDNVAYGSLGVSGSMGDGHLGIEWYGEEPAQPGAEARQELTLYGGYPLSAKTRLQGYLFQGLSDASADLGAGVSVVWGL